MTYDPRQVTETPFAAPLVPRLPLRMRNTEILTTIYRTDREAAERLLPAPLELLGDLVLVHLYRMHDADVFGSYGESAVHLPARHPRTDTVGVYSPFLFVESDAAIAAGREIYGQPKKQGEIELRADGDTLVGRLSRRGAEVFTVTTTLERAAATPDDLERQASFRTNLNLKVVPSVDGNGAALRQLTAREFADVSIHQVWKGWPVTVEIQPNDDAPLHLLPVREVVEAFHWRLDFTLVYGRVLEDLL